MRRHTLVSRVRKEYAHAIEKRTLVEAVEGLLLGMVCYDIVDLLQEIADKQSVGDRLPAGKLYDEFLVSVAILEDALNEAKTSS